MQSPQPSQKRKNQDNSSKKSVQRTNEKSKKSPGGQPSFEESPEKEESKALDEEDDTEGEIGMDEDDEGKKFGMPTNKNPETQSRPQKKPLRSILEEEEEEIRT